MKIQLLVFSIGVLLSGCAGVRVANVEVASGETNPEAIYIRPFNMNYAAYNDGRNPNGAVRASLIPKAFAGMLEEQLGKLAPAMVINDHEYPPLGWLVEGDIDCLDAYSSTAMKIHFRITDYGTPGGARFNPSKAGVDTYQAVRHGDGRIVYEFDVKGGQLARAPFHNNASRSGRDGVYEDLQNAAERVMLALSPDPFRYGARGTPNQRN